MAWTDRLKEAAYTSPSGIRLTFDYENVRKAFDKNGGAFEFPDADGTFIQQLGNSGRRYPLRLIFSGTNYDLEANAFEEALREEGVGKLDHPIYGSVDVVPFGQVTRRDDLKTAANQAIIEVVFWSTIGLVFPTAQVDLAGETAIAVAEFNAAQAEEFADGIGSPGPSALDALADKYNSFLDTTEAGLTAIADTQEAVGKQFDAIVSSINRGIDVLIADPLALAFQTSIMIQAPARAIAAIEARLTAYADLAQSIFAPTTETEPETDPEVLRLSNEELRTRDLYVSSYVTGSIISSINVTFETRVQALTAAEDILNQLDQVSTWRDVAYADSEQVDTGAAIQALQQAVAVSAAFLVQASFSLKQERAIVLDRDRTIVDLAAELYGEVDNQLDFLIDSNDLSGDEILELPKGRTIVYYT